MLSRAAIISVRWFAKSVCCGVGVYVRHPHQLVTRISMIPTRFISNANVHVEHFRKPRKARVTEYAPTCCSPASCLWRVRSCSLCSRVTWFGRSIDAARRVRLRVCARALTGATYHPARRRSGPATHRRLHQLASAATAFIPPRPHTRHHHQPCPFRRPANVWVEVSE